MFDKLRLENVLADYKMAFESSEWANEKYKWEAVKCFQDHWDVNAEDFTQMLHRSLKKTSNLLASAKNFPRQMIEGFAKDAPEEVRAMFLALFDESQDVYERMMAFKDQASIMLEKCGNGAAQHFQYENAISVYLWLRYPDKYYIYKYCEVKTAAHGLESDYTFKKGAYAENIRNTIKFYDEVCEELKQDTALVDLFRSHLTDTCYPDPQLRTLTQDVMFYCSRRASKKSDGEASKLLGEWFPENYDPGLNVDDWIRLLGNKKVFKKKDLEIMRRMKDYGGQATCTQLARRYGQTMNFYNAGSVALAKRIVNETGCPIMKQDQKNARWWPVLYLGKNAGKDEEGCFIWKLRDELSEALDKTDLSAVQLYALPESGDDDCHYWWLKTNPKLWSFSSLAAGEVVDYTIYNENGIKRSLFQNFPDARPNDMVIAYESSPVQKIVGLARVSREQDGETLSMKKTEGLMTPIDCKTLKAYPELEEMECFADPKGGLFRLTKGEFDFIMDIIREENPLAPENTLEAYTRKDFLEEVYMPESRYDQIKEVLTNKKNIILQGAPGVGKTFAAKRLAYSMMGEKDEGRIEFVQFHQNYSYEDFMMGYKPVEDGFELKNGIFYRFCQKAANRPDKDFFFIIDEINRGNISRIFGELLMLIEKDYRGVKATLAYNGLPFAVPGNLYIIGMMNTADRSLAMIDYALRRRFSFLEMEPGFDAEGFIEYQKSLESETLDELVEKVKDLNREIASEKSLGKGFCIGHSYFCGQETCTDEWLRSVVDFDILPLLSEYWFDDTAQLQRWSNILHGVFQ